MPRFQQGGPIPHNLARPLMPRFQQGGPIPHKKPGEGSDAPPTLKRSGSERQEERLHPLPFWKGRGLGSGLRTPSSQEGGQGSRKNMGKQSLRAVLRTLIKIATVTAWA